MRKKSVFAAIALVVVVGIVFMLGCVVLWPGMYMNNQQLTADENSQMKDLVLSAVKDRCSSVYEIDKNAVYDEAYADCIVQYDDQAASPQSWFCFINPGFMRTATQMADGKYQITVKVYHPESYDYCFEISKINEQYVITSFGIDA